jgi:enoyl-CoA hydratase/carnithine racemase
MGHTLLRDMPAPGVVLLTLNRPAMLNALDEALARDLLATLAALATDDETKVIVITGAGDRAFSAGFDIHEMAGWDANRMAAAFALRDPLVWHIANHPKPVIAALNGITYGVGALIAAAADIRIGCPTMRFKVTASAYGGANATWTLPRIVGMAKAKEILMMGRVVDAQEALGIGLLNQLSELGQAVEAAIDMAKAIAANPAPGVQGVKMLINESVGRSYGDAYRAEYAWMAASAAAAPVGGGDLFAGFLAKKPHTDPA